jgi:DMSO reductase anchor subunit
MAEVWLPLWALLAAEAFLILFGPVPAHETAGKIRGVCIALAVVGVGLLPVAPEAARMWLSLPIILLIFAEEVLGRWLFYEMRQPAL